MVLGFLLFLLAQVKDLPESFFEVFLSFRGVACVILLSRFDEDGTHNACSLHRGQNVNKENGRREGTFGEAPAQIILTALQHISSMGDDWLARHNFDNVKTNEECVPAEVPARLQIKLFLQSFLNFVKFQRLESFTLWIELDIPLLEVFLDFEEECNQVNNEEETITCNHNVGINKGLVAAGSSCPRRNSTQYNNDQVANMNWR